MIRLFLFVCTSFPGEAALITDAATIPWTSAGRRPAGRCASSTRITPVRRGRREGTIGAMIAEPDQDRPRTQILDRTHHRSRRPPTSGLHRMTDPTNRIMELSKVTRLAKNDAFSKVRDGISRHAGAETLAAAILGCLTVTFRGECRLGCGLRCRFATVSELVPPGSQAVSRSANRPRVDYRHIAHA